MLNHELTINMTFKEQNGINLERSFSGATMMPVRNCWKGEHLFSFTSNVLWKKIEYGIQVIDLNSLFYHGQQCMCWLCVFSAY